MGNQVTKEGITFRCQNSEEFKRIYSDIFSGEEYKPTTNMVSSPRIIDCGAHIGVSLAYFKRLYPDAHIIAFEPNPTTFTVLNQNISQNNWSDIEAINAAIDTEKGHAELIISQFSDNPWTWGDSLVKNDWYSPHTTRTIPVSSVRLSQYLDKPVQLLKLDVEGLEARVMKEISPKIQAIQELFIEYHGSDANPENSLEAILSVLSDNGFEYTLKQDGEIRTADQISHENPRWIIIHAWNRALNFEEEK